MSICFLLLLKRNITFHIYKTMDWQPHLFSCKSVRFYLMKFLSYVHTGLKAAVLISFKGSVVLVKLSSHSSGSIQLGSGGWCSEYELREWAMIQEVFASSLIDSLNCPTNGTDAAAA